MLLLRTLTACYASVMNVHYTVAVEFEDLEGSIVATAEAHPAYLTSTITYDVERLMTETESFIRETVVHELTHIMTWELAELAEQASKGLAWRLWEQYVTRVERWHMWQGVCSASTN